MEPARHHDVDPRCLLEKPLHRVDFVSVNRIIASGESSPASNSHKSAIARRSEPPLAKSETRHPLAMTDLTIEMKILKVSSVRNRIFPGPDAGSQ